MMMSVNAAHTYFVAPVPICEFSPVGAHEHAVCSLQALYYIFSGCVRPNGSLRVTSALNLECLLYETNESKKMKSKNTNINIKSITSFTVRLAVKELILALVMNVRAETCSIFIQNCQWGGGGGVS